MDFEWDEEKAASNLKKHGISFPYATRAFEDPMRCERFEVDIDHGEERCSITGLVTQRAIVVIFTWRETRIRIISARKATDDERRDYWEDRIFHP